MKPHVYSGSGDFNLELEFDLEHIAENQMDVLESNYILKNIAEKSGVTSVHTMFVVGRYGYAGVRGAGGNDEDTCYDLDVEYDKVIFQPCGSKAVEIVFTGSEAQNIGELPYIDASVECEVERIKENKK